MSFEHRLEKMLNELYYKGDGQDSPNPEERPSEEGLVFSSDKYKIYEISSPLELVKYSRGTKWDTTNIQNATNAIREFGSVFIVFKKEGREWEHAYIYTPDKDIIINRYNMPIDKSELEGVIP